MQALVRTFVSEAKGDRRRLLWGAGSWHWMHETFCQLRSFHFLWHCHTLSLTVYKQTERVREGGEREGERLRGNTER